MLDSLFELLPEPEQIENKSSKRKLLTFSDGRQDAAFFASDYQRTHTEILYRQMLWQAFQKVKNAEEITSVTQLINKLKAEFIEVYIPHPDRKSDLNYKSYRPNDPEEEPKDRKSKIDAEDLAEKRAKEILLREFALAFNRRSTLEAFALLTCHIELDERLIELVARKFEITNDETRIFLTVLTDIIRRTGIVSIEGSSNYFPETGGDGSRPEMVENGKSKNYLFLEKSEDETKRHKDSPSFMPWKDGKVRKPPNRLGWYFLRIFCENFPEKYDNFPTKENFTWLFQKLQDFGLLVQAKKGYQLNWGQLNIIQTQQDWYQCNCCKQIFHVPDLSKIQESKLSLQRCPAYKCTGTLEPYTPEKIEQKNVAITLMYGQRRPHDRFYFEQPEQLIAGSNQIPKLDSGNFQIQQRHIRAELVAVFLRDNWNLSAEEVTMAEFLHLPLENPASSQKFTPTVEAMICKLQAWLKTDEAASLTALWLTRLGAEVRQAATILAEFDQEIEKFQEQQLKDWDSLAEVMAQLQNRITDLSERKNVVQIAKLIERAESEIKKIAARRLHDELAQASILPIYGFPIDVVRLLTGESNEYNSAQGRHRLERDRRLALGEYAPDQEIVVDDRVYKSVGILKPAELEKKYYRRLVTAYLLEY